MLAHQGRRVCLIERNKALGGCASTYKVGALTIEAALHETADPHDCYDPKHHVLARLGLLDQIDWVPVGPIYEARGGLLGTEPFVLDRGFDPARAAFRRRFPASAAATDRILRNIEGVVDMLGGLTLARELHSLFAVARSLAGVGRLVGRLAQIAGRDARRRARRR